MNRLRFAPRAAAPAAMLLVVAAWLGGCGDPVSTRPLPSPANPFAADSAGTDSTFDVATWNLHDFATSAGDTTVALVAQAILALKLDVVALQEVAEAQRFRDLLARLPGWTGTQATSNAYQNLAFVWRTATVTPGPEGIREILTGDARAFPRPPLAFDLVWRGHALLLVDNHLKCCGDGGLDVADAWDEETRRRDACVQLAGWLATSGAGRAAIVLGDLNDLLTDAAPNNVFTAFLDHPEAYRFADMAVATGPAAGWSWGPGQSHLDHLLVTAPLFAATSAPGSLCHTIRLDRSFPAYRSQVSDHAPVVLRLDLDP